MRDNSGDLGPRLKLTVDTTWRYHAFEAEMTDRVVLITGGGIGIGRATALAFADHACHVVVTDVLEAEGNAVVAEILGKGGSADFEHLDVTDTVQANAVVAGD